MLRWFVAPSNMEAQGYGICHEPQSVTLFCGAMSVSDGPLAASTMQKCRNGLFDSLDTALKITTFIGGGASATHDKLLAKSETAGNTTADWSDHGSFATSVRSSDDFASSISLGDACLRAAVRQSFPPIITPAGGSVAMCAKTLVPDPSVITIERIVPDDTEIVLVSRTRRYTAPCPVYGESARRIHSWYICSLRDLPWQGLTVRMELHTRRWFCDNSSCPRRIFTERLPTVAVPFSQRTTRLATIVLIFGVALGGAPGARLLAELGIPINGVTLLRAVMGTTLPGSGAPHVLGVDDWCRRKGRTYETILVDMEQHRPIDLLLGREAAPLAQWLGDYPAVGIICRDRAGTYADGARQGAPEALQVADRWHLLKNLGEALGRRLQRHHPALTATAHTLTQQGRAAALQAIGANPSDALPAQSAGIEAVLPRLNRTQLDQQHRRERHLARYEAVLDLHRQGLGVRAIARQLHIGRRVVRQYLATPAFPERVPNRPRRTVLTPYEPYLRMR